MAKRYAHKVTRIREWESVNTLPKPTDPRSFNHMPCLTWRLISVVGDRFYWEREYDVPD